MGRKIKTLIIQTGRVCTCCNIKKVWSCFSKDNASKTGYTPTCKECRNKYKKEYRENKEIRKNELEYKKQYRENNKLKLKLDNLYYPATRQNRLITGKRNRKEALKTKIEYLHFTLGYPLIELKKIYSFNFSL